MLTLIENALSQYLFYTWLFDVFLCKKLVFPMPLCTRDIRYRNTKGEQGMGTRLSLVGNFHFRSSWKDAEK